MAEYFPLIDRAITSLPNGTAEARRAIYERARAALIGQLRKTEPPVPEEDITRESTALDEAIARVEAKFADHGTGASPPPAQAPQPRIAPPPSEAAAPAERVARAAPAKPSPARAPALPRLAERPDPAPGATGPARPVPGSPAARRGAPAVPPLPLPIGKVPPVVPPPARERPVIGPAPTVAGEARPGIAAARPLAANRPGRPTLPLRPGAPADAPGAGPAPFERGAADVASSAAGASALPLAADLAVTRPEPKAAGTDSADAEAARAESLGSEEAASVAASPTLPRARDAALRPAAPRPAPPRRFGWPAALMGVLVVLVMVGVGFAAWKLRDKPAQLAAAHPVTQAPETQDAGKIVDRAASAQDDAADASSSGAAVPAPVGQNGGGDAGPAIAVAQRAALLVDAPDDPQKVKTYQGTVVWHLDSVSSGQGLPLVPAVKADIDIPDAKLKVTVVMQRNVEPQLPASHTIELHFLPQPGYTLGNVTQINVPEMRKDDAPAGDALAGVPVMIDANNFLVGLSRGGAEAQNRRLITERNWFDVSVLFAPKRPGKLTFEKGGDGQRLWDQAFAAWGDAKGAASATP